MIKKLALLFFGVIICSCDCLQASYLSRLSVYSKQISQVIQTQASSFMGKIKTYDIQKLKTQLEDSLKDTVQQAEIIEPMIKDSLKDGSRKSIHMNKSGLFGKAESVVIENVQINHHGSKSFSECFFTWLKEGGQKRVAVVGVVLGVTGGYALGSSGKQQQTQPQIIVIPAPANQQ